MSLNGQLQPETKETQLLSRSSLLARAQQMNAALARERKAMMFYLTRALEINYRDNFETQELVRLKGETVRAWRVGECVISDRQLYSYFDRFVKSELGNIVDRSYQDIPMMRELFCDWLVARAPEFLPIVRDSEAFRNDVEVLIAAHLNDSLFEAFCRGQGRSYMALMGRGAIIALLQWGTMRQMRRFAHEAVNRAAKYGKLTDSSKRISDAFIADIREQLREVTSSALGRFSRALRELKEGDDDDDDKPTGSLL